jgi:phosphoribosyl 1,2-cyclic phosphodiesterase
MTGKHLQIRFWGTRGSRTPDAPSSEFGIHTTCVEIIPGRGRPFFIDLGTGAGGAAEHALAAGLRQFDVFMTHLHSDHVTGIFGFTPVYRSDCQVTIQAARPELKKAFATLLGHPFHPVDIADLSANVALAQLPAAGTLALPERELQLRWAPVHHPQGCIAYRVDDGENALVFATDVELGGSGSEQQAPLVELITQPFPAGLAVLDGYFTRDEIERFRGWGHSTWQEAAELGQRTGAGTVLITHHHQSRSDAQLAALARNAAPVQWAHDGHCWVLTANQARQLD